MQKFQRDTNLSDKDVMESLNQEIAFYRGKLNSFTKYVIAIQALIITGQKTFTGVDTVIGKILFTVLFLFISIISFYMRESYKTRLYESRDMRQLFFSDYNYPKLFHDCGGIMLNGNKLISPSLLWLIVSYVFTTGGIILVWC